MLKESSDTKEIICMLVVFIVLLLVLFFVYGYAVYDDTIFNGPNQITNAALFGDSFGVLTSLFTGLAFAGLIATILLQRKDINLQQSELQETRKVMEKQNFEATFFQMAKMLNDIVESTADKDVKGRECFSRFASYLNKQMSSAELAVIGQKDLFERKSNGDPTVYEEGVNYFFKEFYSWNQTRIEHYLRYLYRIFKYIDESREDGRIENDKFYGKIIRAQLSDQELVVLFYNGLSEQGKKFSSYIERYSLFDNLPIDDLAGDVELLTRLYSDEAYGDNPTFKLIQSGLQTLAPGDNKEALNDAR